MKTRSVAFEMHTSVGDVAQVVTAAFAQMRAHVEAISPPSPDGAAGPVAEIAVVGQRTAVVHPWAIEVYVHDLGDKTGIELVALGETGSAWGWRGLRQRSSLAASINRLEALVDRLRASDPQARQLA